MDYLYAHAPETSLGKLERDFHRSFQRSSEVRTPTDDIDAQIVVEETANGWVICRDFIAATSSLEDFRRTIAVKMVEEKVKSMRGKNEEEKLRASTRAYVFELAYRKVR